MPDYGLREFAQLKGVSLQAVQNAIKAGRIVKNKQGRLNESQLKAWDDLRDPSKVRAHNDPKKKNGAKGEPEEGASTYQKAKIQKEVYVAQLRKLEYEEASKKVVSRDEVTAAVFDFARGARDAVMNIPDRVGAEAAAEVVSYLRPLLTKEAGEKKANAIIEAISVSELTRIMHRLWDREGRYVLEHLERGADL